MRRKLVIEETISDLQEGSTLRVTEPFTVTPLALDLAQQRHITIVGISPSDAGPAAADRADHAIRFDPSIDSLAAKLDSTLLLPDATPDQIISLCHQAVELGVKAVCVNPLYVKLAVLTLDGRGPVVATVVGFPLGAIPSVIKAAEAGLAEAEGAREFDMVLPVGKLKAGDYACVRDDIARVRNSLKRPSSLLKVIIEAPLLSSEEKVAASIIAVEAGADFVKTGTGLSGPATIEDVILIRQAVGDRAQVKAAGGIANRQTAIRMLAAGANRIGTSKAAVVLA